MYYVDQSKEYGFPLINLIVKKIFFLIFKTVTVI